VSAEDPTAVSQREADAAPPVAADTPAQPAVIEAPAPQPTQETAPASTQSTPAAPQPSDAPVDETAVPAQTPSDPATSAPQTQAHTATDSTAPASENTQPAEAASDTTTPTSTVTPTSTTASTSTVTPTSTTTTKTNTEPACPTGDTATARPTRLTSSDGKVVLSLSQNGASSTLAVVSRGDVKAPVGLTTASGTYGFDQSSADSAVNSTRGSPGRVTLQYDPSTVGIPQLYVVNADGSTTALTTSVDTQAHTVSAVLPRAGDVVAAVQTSKTRMTSVQGRVVGPSGGEVIAGAVVQASSDGVTVSAITDATGAFSLGLNAGPWTITVDPRANYAAPDAMTIDTRQRILPEGPAVSQSLTLQLGLPASGVAGAPLSNHQGPSADTFDLGDGNYQTVMTDSATPINYLGADGQWHRIDSTLVAATDSDYALASAANAFQAQFARDASADALVGLTLADNTTISVSLNGASSSTVKRVGSDGLIYADALPGADLVYKLTASGVKEAISLANAGGPSSYSFTFTPSAGSDLVATALPDGSWAFVHASTGEVAFRLERPTASDSAGSTTTDDALPANPVAMEVRTNRDGTFGVFVSLDRNWLADPRRLFPILVDPTITVGPDSRDANFSLSSPGSAATLGTTLNVASGSSEAAVQFDLGQIPSGHITGAQLKLTWVGCAPSTCTGSQAGDIGVYQLAAPWSLSSTATSLAAGSPTYLSDTTITGTSLLNNANGVIWTIPTMTIENWLSGAAPNYGLLVKPHGASTTSPFNFTGSAAGDAANAPRLVVAWSGDAPLLLQPSIIHSNGAELSWSQFDSSTTTGTSTGATFTSYQILRGLNGGALSTIATLNDSAVTTFIDTTAAPSQNFTYQVITLTGGTTSNASDKVTVTTPIDGRAIAIFQAPPQQLSPWVIAPSHEQATMVELSQANYGLYGYLRVGGSAGDRTLVRYDLRQVAPSATVTSATLGLYANYTTGTPGTVSATQLAGDWSETAVTWANMPTTTGSSVTSSAAVSADSWTTFDLTTMVAGWLNASQNNFGVSIATASTAWSAQWWSDELPYGGALSPKLTIVYQDGSHAHGPLVAMGAPGAGNLISGSSVLLTAAASDDGAVSSVTFSLDSATPIGSAISSGPWQTTLNTTSLTRGLHTITVTATDDAGNVASSQINVTVASASPTITAPTVSGSGTGTVTISTTAFDDVAVSRVEFYVDNVRVGTTTGAGPTYTASWNTLTSYDGVHSVMAKAYDADGQVTTSGATSYTASNTTGTPYRAGYSITGVPGEMTYDPTLGTQASAAVNVVVTNNATTTMTAASTVLRYQWISSDDVPVISASANIALSADIASGTSQNVAVTVLPPTLPTGAVRARYTLRLDLFNTSTSTYFAAAGNAPGEKTVTVNLATDVRLGLEGYHQYDSEDLGGGVINEVNLANGNNVVGWTPFSEPGIGLNSVLTVTYNSLEIGSVSSAGNNVSLAISGLVPFGAPLDIKAGASIAYTDADGSYQKFTLQSGGYYAAPAGINLYLRQSSTTDTTRWYALTKPNGTTYYFDQTGYQTAVVDSNGNTLAITQTTITAGNDAYGLAKHATAVTDQGGRSFTIGYYGSTDAPTIALRGKIKTITDHLGQQLQFSYYDDGNLLAMTELAGQNTDGSWTSSRSLVFNYTTVAGTGPAVTTGRATPNPSAQQSTKLYSVQDFLGHETTFAYSTSGSDQGRLTSRTNRAGSLTTFAYNTSTRTTTECMALTTSGCPTTGRIWAYTFDVHGRMVSRQDPVSPSATTYTWTDATNTVSRITEPTGAHVDYAYNANGQLTDSWDALGNHTSMTYSSSPVDANDVAGKWQTGRTIAHMSLLTSKTTPNGNTSSPYFDGDTPGAAWLGLTATNLITNPSFETGATGWSPAAGSFTNSGAVQTIDSTSPAVVGSAALKIVTTGASAGEGSSNQVAGTFLFGTTYVFSVSIRGQAGGEKLSVVIGDNSSGTTDARYQAYTVTTSWQRYSILWTPTANRSNVSVAVTGVGTARTYWLDAAEVSPGTDPAYFDGGSPGAYWTGTPGASTSVRPANGSVSVFGNTVANLLTNPSFETGVSGWSSAVGFFNNSGAVQSQDATTASSGSASLKIATSGVKTAMGSSAPASGTFLAGTIYSFSVRLKGLSGGELVNLALGDTTRGSADDTYQSVTVTTGWQTYSILWTPTVNRSNVGVAVRAGTATAMTFWVDGAIVTTGTDPSYFDGSSPNAYWTGTPGASTSVHAAPDANLLANPSFESGLTGWTSTSGFFNLGGSIQSQDLTAASSGTASLKLVTTSANAAQGSSTQIAGIFLAGNSYAFTIRLLGQAGGERINLALGDTTPGSTDYVAQPFNLTTGWQTYAVMWTPTANRTNVGVAVRSQSATSMTFWADAAAVIPPATAATTLTNLVTNPSFETGTTGWSTTTSTFIVSAGATQALDATTADTGSKSLLVTTTSSASGQGTGSSVTGAFVAGQTYTVSLRLKGAVGGEALTLMIGSSDVGSTDVLTTSITLTNAWAIYKVTWTAAASHSSAAIAVRTLTAAATNFSVDSVDVNAGAAVTYFDGDSAGAFWTGTPGASTSTKTINTPYNLVANSTFSSSTSGWSSTATTPFTVTGATISRDGTVGADGPDSMRIVTTNAAAQQGAYTTVTGGVAVAGWAYTLSMRLKGLAGGEQVSILVGDNAYSGADSATQVFTLTQSWNTYTITWTPTAARSALRVVVRTPSALAETFWVDGVSLLDRGSAAFVDGNTPGHAWTGAPNASPTSDTIVNHVLNPSVESGTTGYTTTSGSTAVQNSSTSVNGLRSLQITAPSAGGVNLTSGTGFSGLVSGRVYTLLAWVFSSAGFALNIGDAASLTSSSTAARSWIRVTTSFVYSGGNVSLLNASATSQTFWVDGVEIIDNSGPTGSYTTTYGYDATGNTITVTDALGATTRSTYNANGTLATQTQPDTGDGITRTTTYNSYDANGNATQLTDAAGGIVRAIYDAAGKLLSSQDANHASFTGGTPSSYQTQNIYDRFGRLIRSSAPLSTTLNPGVLIWRDATYDAEDNVLSTANPHYGAGDSPGAPVTTTVYDAMDRPTITTSPDTSGSTTRQSVTHYDAAGRVDMVTNPKGVATTGVTDDFATLTTYDNLNRVVTTTQKSYGTGGIVIVRITRNWYDTAGDLRWVMGSEDTATSWPTLSAPESSVYDTPTGGDTTSYLYDAAHRPVRQIDALGNTSDVIYDANGQAIVSIDANHALTSTIYDARGQKAATVQPFDGPIVNAADVTHNLVTLYRYDAIGNLIQQISPRSYDTSAAKQTFGSFVTSYTYDALNRAVTTTTSTGSYSTIVEADRPWGYWRMDETSGTTAFDASGNASNMTYSGTATFGAAGALTADRDPSVVFASATTTRAAEAGINDSFALEMWVDWDITGGTVQTLFINGTQGSTGWALQLNDGTTNNNHLYLMRDATTTDLGYTLTAGWKDIALVNDQGTFKLYVNGALISTNALSDPSTPTGNMQIGGAGSGQRFTGRIDEVSLYANTAATPYVSPLSAAQVLAHYQAGTSRLTSGNTYQHVAYDANGNVLWSSQPTTQSTPAAAAADVTVKRTINQYLDTGAVYSTASATTPKTRTTYTAEGGTQTVTPETAVNSGVRDLARQQTSTYLADGKLASTTDQAGLRTIYVYDLDGNRTSLTQVLGLGSPTTAVPLTVTAEFDGFDQLTKVRVPRQTTVTPASYWVTLFGYDLHGNTTTLVSSREELPNGTLVAAGRTQTFTFNALNQNTTELDDRSTPTNANDDERLVITYSPTGLEATRSLSKANGSDWTVEQYVASTYFANGLEKTQRTTSDDPIANPSAALISSHVLSYIENGVYLDGNRASDVFQLIGADSSASCDTTTCTSSWSYDTRDRLLREATGTGPNTTYTMDVYGQNTAEWTITAGGPTAVLTRSATYNVTRLVSDTTNGVSQKYFYDSVGNLSCVTTNAFAGTACPAVGDATLLTTHTYDTKNRLTATYNYSAGAMTNSSSYVLDGLDRTLSRLENNYGVLTRTDYTYIGISSAIAAEQAYGSTGTGGTIRPDGVTIDNGWGGSFADLVTAVADDNGATYAFATGGVDPNVVEWTLEDMGFDPGNGLSNLTVTYYQNNDPGLGTTLTITDPAGNVYASSTGSTVVYAPSTPLGPTAASDLRVRITTDAPSWTALYARADTMYVYWNSALINSTGLNAGLADTKSYSYDANGRPLTLSDAPAGEPVTNVSYVYSPTGSVESVVDPSRNVKASYGYTTYGQSNLSLTTAAHGISPRANNVKYAGSQYDIGSDTYSMQGQRYSPDLERDLGAPASGGSTSSKPIDGNRAALESPSGSCIAVQSTGCGSFAFGRVAANRDLANRITVGRDLRADAWNASYDAFLEQAEGVWTDPSWTDAEANHYFGYYFNHFFGADRHLDLAPAGAAGPADEGSYASDGKHYAMRATGQNACNIYPEMALYGPDHSRLSWYLMVSCAGAQIVKLTAQIFKDDHLWEHYSTDQSAIRDTPYCDAGTHTYGLYGILNLMDPAGLVGAPGPGPIGPLGAIGALSAAGASVGGLQTISQGSHKISCTGSKNHPFESPEYGPRT
jgi:YD repeat-containing protein